MLDAWIIVNLASKPKNFQQIFQQLKKLLRYHSPEMSRPLSTRSSYRRAARISRRSRSNLYRSFWLLPRPKRQAMYALYSFARTADDLGDCNQPQALRTHWLRWWRDAAELNMPESADGRNDDSLDCHIQLPKELAAEGSKKDIQRWPVDIQRRALETMPALRDTAIKYRIPSHYLLEIVDGVIADQQKSRFETYEQLEHFSALAATSVGIACMHIWGFKDPLPTTAALDCGMAFQLTNILRDISEDAKRGRIYLPRQHYEQHGLSEDDLLSPRPDDRLQCLVIDEADRARELFRSGWQVWDSLHADGRPIFSMMWRTYRRILDKIIEDPKAVAEHRIRLSYSEKLGIRARHFIGPLYRRLPVPPAELE